MGQHRPGSVLRFTVADTGIGISAASQARLFDAFTQADNSITRRYGGTGLGLAICRSLVTLMGGHIGVNSQLGQGSEFWFSLPLIEPASPSHVVGASPLTGIQPLQAQLAKAAKPAMVTTRIAAPNGQGMQGQPSGSAPALNSRPLAHLSQRHILLAEDNRLNQIVACEFLERMGLDVTVAENGQAALDTLRSHPPEHFAAILMDLHMPEMDGLHATRLIRALPGLAHLPIIAMTAAALQEDRDACLAAGMVDHVTKPVMPDQLLAVLLKWLGSASSGSVSTNQASDVSAGLHAQGHQADAKHQGSEGFDAFEGFDLPGFRRRLLGNEALMWKLLGQFTELEKHTGEHIATLVAQGALDATRKEVHRLKGCAANLGAQAVAEACAQIEAELRHHAVNAQSLDALQQALSHSLTLISAQLAARDTVSSHSHP
jgi:two-component system, sensor histidine kinase and response regulator